MRTEASPGARAAGGGETGAGVLPPGVTAVRVRLVLLHHRCVIYATCRAPFMRPPFISVLHRAGVMRASTVERAALLVLCDTNRFLQHQCDVR